MKLHWLLFGIFCASSAQAQQVMDNSDKGLPDKEREVIMRLLLDASPAPYSIQLRRLSRKNGKRVVWCGEINSKNRSGGYQGFKVFAANPDQKVLYSPYEADGSVIDAYDGIIRGQCE